MKKLSLLISIPAEKSIKLNLVFKLVTSSETGLIVPDVKLIWSSRTILFELNPREPYPTANEGRKIQSRDMAN